MVEAVHESGGRQLSRSQQTYGRDSKYLTKEQISVLWGRSREK